MVSAETLLSYPDWKIPFTVHTYASYKQLGAVVSHNNKPIAFFSRRLIKTQRKYTTTEKGILVIVKFLSNSKELFLAMMMMMCLVSVPGRHAWIMRRCGLEQICCSNLVPTSYIGQSSPRLWVPNPHSLILTRRSNMPMTRDEWMDTEATATGKEQSTDTGGTNFLPRWDSQLPRVLKTRDLVLLYQNTRIEHYPALW